MGKRKTSVSVAIAAVIFCQCGCLRCTEEQYCNEEFGSVWGAGEPEYSTWVGPTRRSIRRGLVVAAQLFEQTGEFLKEMCWRVNKTFVPVHSLSSNFDASSFILRDVEEVVQRTDEEKVTFWIEEMTKTFQHLAVGDACCLTKSCESSVVFCFDSNFLLLCCYLPVWTLHSARQCRVCIFVFSLKRRDWKRLDV